MPPKRRHSTLTGTRAQEAEAKRPANVPLYSFDELFSAGTQWASDQQQQLAPLCTRARELSQMCADTPDSDTLVLKWHAHSIEPTVDAFRELFPHAADRIRSDTEPRTFVQEIVRYLTREQDALVRFLSEAHRLSLEYCSAQDTLQTGETPAAREVRVELIRALYDIYAPFINRNDDKTIALVTESQRQQPPQQRPTFASALTTTNASANAADSSDNDNNNNNNAKDGEPVCRVCKKGLLVYYKLDADDVCQGCGAVAEVKLVDDVMPPQMSYKGVPSGISVQKKRPGYTRITFFREWLRKVQAKSRREVPDSVRAAVYNKAKQLGYKTLHKKDVRKIQKRLKLSAYFDMDIMMAMEFNDVPVVSFSPAEIETFESMFLEAEALFEECPYEIKRRKNFLSYAYFLYKVCELLDWDAYLASFPLLSGTTNLGDHDRYVLCLHC